MCVADLGLHNIVFAADVFAPLGVIDFEAAAYVDRRFDFRYLILDFADTTLLTTACRTYAASTGAKHCSMHASCCTTRLVPAVILRIAQVFPLTPAGVAARSVRTLPWTTLALQRFRTGPTEQL